MFADKLKELRENRSMTQRQLADELGISKSALSNYECGMRLPKNNKTWVKIAKYFNVTVDDLMDVDGTDDDDRSTHNIIPLKSREEKHMEIYSRLNQDGKDMADDYVTMLAETPKYTNAPLEKVHTSLAYYDIPVSAGTGQFLSDSGYIMLDVTEAPPLGAEFIVRVCGDSMEPTYKDGDKLYIAPVDELAIGDIGIFSVNGDVYVKERGERELISHNPNYAPILIGGHDSVSCFGRVVGICKNYR